MKRDRWRLAAILACLLASAGASRGQEPERNMVPAGAPTLQTSTTLVLVPATVRTTAGDLAHGLSASDFRVLDDGVPQRLTLDEETALEPLDLVLVLQTGGAATQEIANYAGLRTMLEYVMKAATGTTEAARPQARVAMVTFDSQPEEEWSFTPDIAELEDGWLRPKPASGGASIYDAVEHGIQMLQHQPAGDRRVLLLVSQRTDEGSTAREAEVVRNLGEANITVYSLTFSPERAWLKDQFTKPQGENPPYQYGANGPLLLHTFDVGTPLIEALHAIRRDAAGEIASLSGGERLPFAGRREFEAAMVQVANSMANRYVLSFRPTSAGGGFHTLTTQATGRPELRVTARSGYWGGVAAAGEKTSRPPERAMPPDVH